MEINKNRKILFYPNTYRIHFAMDRSMGSHFYDIFFIYLDRGGTGFNPRKGLIILSKKEQTKSLNLIVSVAALIYGLFYIIVWTKIFILFVHTAKIVKN